MLCDEDLYRAQIAVLGDVVESLPLVVAEAGMAESAAAVLRRAPALFVLAGTSYGASLALEVAVTAPSRVLGLWLMGCNPGPHGNPDAARRLGGRVEAGEFEAVVDELAQRTVYARGPNGLVAGAAFRSMARRLGPVIFLQQNATLLERQDRRGDRAGIDCPTLLIWGREDEFAGIAHGSLMASRMPRANLVVLEDCGHLPSIEQPAAVTDAVGAWLRQV